MENKIKGVQFVLENCESITIPYQCFDKFEITTDDIKNDDTQDGYIKTLDCTIKDHGNIEYGGIIFVKDISPIKRLSNYNDITWIYIYYKDKSQKKYYTNWYDGDKYYNEDNKNQTSELIDYRTINVKIAPYILRYSLADIFEFAVGEAFQGEKDKATIKIEWDINGNKFISNINKLTEQQVRQSYIRVS